MTSIRHDFRMGCYCTGLYVGTCLTEQKLDGSGPYLLWFWTVLFLSILVYR